MLSEEEQVRIWGRVRCKTHLYDPTANKMAEFCHNGGVEGEIPLPGTKGPGLLAHQLYVNSLALNQEEPVQTGKPVLLFAEARPD